MCFVDGACQGGTVKNPGPMGAGVVMIMGPHQGEFGEYLGLGTNSRAELLAVRAALVSVPDEVDRRQLHVTVYSDSTYAIGICTGSMAVKANQDIITPLLTLITCFGGFEMHHVPGHKGHPLNERAHDLATAASRPAASPAMHLDETEQEREIEALVQALQYYSDPLTYLPPPGGSNRAPSITHDCGQVARAVLLAMGYEVSDDPFEEVA